MECIYDFWKVAGDACYGGQPSYVSDYLKSRIFKLNAFSRSITYRI